MGPVIRYSVYRMGLFVAAVAVVYLLGARGLLLLVLSLLVSLALSYVLLRGPRQDVARALQERTERRLPPRRPGVDEAAEDAAVDGRPRPDEP
jgi:hypothetical protein